MEYAGERVNCLMQKGHGVDFTDAIKLPASFDGCWCSCGWTTNKGIVSAIVEVSSQVIEFFSKCRCWIHSDII